MAVLLWASRIAFLRMPHWRKMRKRILNAIRTAGKRLFSIILTLIAIIGGVALLTFSFGINLSMFTHNDNANAASTIQTKLVATPPPSSSCATSNSQTDPSFAICPSFLVDYSNQTSGTVNTNDFTVYAGAPVANNEAEFYTSSQANVHITNGSLWLEALNQPVEAYNYTSGHIDTHGKEDFLYGKFIVRAIVPGGAGTWPAVWMLASQPKYASQSPASDPRAYLNDGEIDILESIGIQPHVVYGVAHSVAYPEDGPDRSYYSTVTVPDNDQTYHNYELDWTPTSLTFAIDGTPYFTYTKKPGADWHSWPFDQPYYLVLNLALGGKWAGSNQSQFPGDGVDKHALPAALQIQSIQYYSYTGSR